MQFIQPKEVNIAHQAPKTTSQASRPPSGKSEVSGRAFVGVSDEECPCSMSASADVSLWGKIFASVCRFSEVTMVSFSPGLVFSSLRSFIVAPSRSWLLPCPGLSSSTPVDEVVDPTIVDSKCPSP